MTSGLSIAFFGSSLLSTHWASGATYYRGLLRALAARGHSITFYEPDACGRQQHPDLAPGWARNVIYRPELSGAQRVVDEARRADVIVKTSDVGVLDDFMEAAVADLRDPSRLVVFWDVDAPATLDRLLTRPLEPLLHVIPSFDLVLTYGGGPSVVEAYTALGARACTPIYNALDPDSHFPAPPDPRFEADLIFIGNRLPDREERVDEFFFGPAERLPHLRFVLGGCGWHDRTLPDNVRYVGHVSARDHNVVNATPRAVLSVNRSSKARCGFSPPTRLFEAAGAGACVISDKWLGIDRFLTPGDEVLVAENGDGVARLLESLTWPQSRDIGKAARRRLLADHTFDRRAAELEAVLVGAQPDVRSSPIAHATLPPLSSNEGANARPYFIY